MVERSSDSTTGAMRESLSRATLASGASDMFCRLLGWEREGSWVLSCRRREELQVKCRKEKGEVHRIALDDDVQAASRVQAQPCRATEFKPASRAAVRCISSITQSARSPRLTHLLSLVPPWPSPQAALSALLAPPISPQQWTPPPSEQRKLLSSNPTATTLALPKSLSPQLQLSTPG